MAGYRALADNSYYMDNCKKIIENREYTARALLNMGFRLTASRANFIFAEHPDISGEELYLALKARGILVRHFSKEKIKNYNRITVGTREEMDALLSAVREIFKEKQL